MTRWLAFLVAASVSCLADCSSDNASSPAASDAGRDTAPPVCENKTTGSRCANDTACNPCGDGANVCTAGAFSGDSFFPTNVCIARQCDPGMDSLITECDGRTGVCLAVSGGGGICLPSCQFSDDGAAPKGCEGSNGCNVYGWGLDTTSKTIIGVGYCFGGCRTDADCAEANGNKCQTESGLCVRAPVVYTKTIGSACTDTDLSRDVCNCIYTNADRAGYCTKVCRYGEASECPTGFTCDPGLPMTALFPDDVVFTKAPSGMLGSCLKNCTTDADCAGLNAYCAENAGMNGQKTCQIGKRPCRDNTQCPMGQTCSGATATVAGRCG